jgi:hypothetical protein
MTQVLQVGAPQVGPKLTTVIPVRIQRSGGRKWMIPAAEQTEGGAVRADGPLNGSSTPCQCPELTANHRA